MLSIVLSPYRSIIELRVHILPYSISLHHVPTGGCLQVVSFSSASPRAKLSGSERLTLSLAFITILYKLKNGSERVNTFDNT